MVFLKLLKKILASLSLSLIIALPAFADKKIAVMPFDTPDKKEETQQFSLGTMSSLIHTLKSVEDYTLVDRAQIDSILKELGFQSSGFTQQDKIKIGKLSGVDILVFGAIQRTNNNYRINVSFTDVQTGNILKTFQVTGTDMFQLQDQLSSEILRGSKLTSKDIIKTTNSKTYNNYIRAKELSNYFDKKNLEKALNILNQIIKSESGYIQAYSARARVNAMLALINKKNGINYLDKFSNAELDAEKSLEENSNDIDSYIALFTTAEIEKKEDSSTIINKALKIDRAEFSNYLNSLGDFARANKNIEDAEYYYKTAINADKNNLYTYSDLARIYVNNKKYDKAIELHEKALSINPNFLNSKYNLASVYIRKNDLVNAKKHYLEIIKSNPDSSSAYFSLGGISGDNEESVNYYKKSIEIDSRFYIAYTALADLYIRMNKTEDALPYAKKAVELKPDDSYSNYVLSMYYAKKGDKKKSLDMTKKIQGNLFFIKNIYLENKMYDEAISIVKNEIKNSPDEAFNYVEIAKVYERMKKYDLAIDFLKNAITKDITPAKKKDWLNQLKEYYFLYGIEEYKKGNYINAIDIYTQASQILEDTNIYNNIGISYYMLKQYDKAIEQYQKALKLNPNHVDSIVNLGMVYEVLGKTSEAENEYKKACALGYKQKCK